MPTFRGVVRHARYWRGAIHSWSTSYQYVGTLSKPIDTAACTLLLNADDSMCFGAVAADGGTYECAIYNETSGGVPLASVTKFALDTPASWLIYGGGSWGNKSSLSFEPVAEIALQVEWAGGLSKTGKGVRFRKWYHAVALSSGVGTTQDVPPANVTALQVGAQSLVGVLGSYGLTMGSPSGRLAGLASVSGFYGNHQMPKGRRRKALVKADGTYTGPQLTLPPGIQEGETD